MLFFVVVNSSNLLGESSSVDAGVTLDGIWLYLTLKFCLERVTESFKTFL